LVGYSSSHKGYKCLDISSGRLYISRDIVFDEIVFPFASLHDNAGARLRAEINHLPLNLQPITLHDDCYRWRGDEWCQRTCWSVVDEVNDRPVGKPQEKV
jgi:hypothetical protein